MSQLQLGKEAYPEVNVEISATTKLAIADLEGDGHPVVRVQLLVEAFARVCLQLDVVCRADGKETAESCIEEGEDEHVCCLSRGVTHKKGMERCTAAIVCSICCAVPWIWRCTVP